MADDRDQTLARTRPWPRRCAARVSASSSWKVRNTVESDGTEPNRSRLEAQVLDVRTALPTAGQHQGGVDEHLAPVVEREPFAVQRDRGRERITQAQSVGKSAKSVQSDVGHHARPAGFHNHARRAGTVHFGSALLLLGSCCLETTVSPDCGGLFRGRGPVSSGGFVNDQG